MRTTLTLDPDVARMLGDEVHRQRKPLKQVVNEALRRALGSSGPRPRRQIRVQPFEGGFQPGVDPLHLNRMVDELDDERLTTRVRRRG